MWSLPTQGKGASVTLERIVSDYRALIAAEKMVLRRSRQLSAVAGDMIQAQNFDTEARGSSAHPSMRIPNFIIESQARRRDAKALETLADEVHQAVKCVQRGLTAADRAIRGGDFVGGTETCIGCGTETILEPTEPGGTKESGYCSPCQAKHRRAQEAKP